MRMRRSLAVYQPAPSTQMQMRMQMRMQMLMSHVMHTMASAPSLPDRSLRACRRLLYLPPPLRPTTWLKLCIPLLLRSRVLRVVSMPLVLAAVTISPSAHDVRAH